MRNYFCGDVSVFDVMPRALYAIQMNENITMERSMMLIADKSRITPA